MLERLIAIAAVFAPLSLLSFGGGAGTIASMHRQAVDVHGWMTDQQFVDLFAISRAAPGPGSLVAALVGWKAAGWAGAVTAALAMYVPSSAIVYGVARVWNRYQGTPWRTALERGLAPIAVGLLFAGGVAVLQAGETGALQIATAVVATGLILWTEVSPYVLIAGAGMVYGGLFLAGV